MIVLNVCEKYYTMLKDGRKTIELRLFDDKRKLIKVGDMIEFRCADDATDSFLAEVINLYRADDFFSLSQKIACQQAGFDTNEEMTDVMKGFYSEAKQKQFGVLGIEVRRI